MNRHPLVLNPNRINHRHPLRRKPRSAMQLRREHLQLLEDNQALIYVRDDKRELEEKLRSPRKDPWATVDLLGSNGGKLKTEGMDRDPWATSVPEMRFRLG